MVVKVKRKKIFLNALLLKQNFPNISKNMDVPGETLLVRAQKIKNFKDKPFFAHYSPGTILKFLTVVLQGGEYVDKISGKVYFIEPMIESFKETSITKRFEVRYLNGLDGSNGVKSWTDEEKEYVIGLYNSGLSVLDIWGEHSLNERFSNRTFFSIENFLQYSRKKGLIGRMNVDWNGNVGHRAMELYVDMKETYAYAAKIAKLLDDEYFLGEGKITRGKVRNFFRRMKNKEEEFLKSGLQVFTLRENPKIDGKVESLSKPLEYLLAT